MEVGTFVWRELRASRAMIFDLQKEAKEIK